MGLTGKGDIVTLHNGQSFDKLIEIYAKGIRADLIYIDGDHSYEAVRADLELSFAACKPGGLICVDDYVLGRWWGNSVLRAVHEVLGGHAEDCGIVYCRDGQVAIEVSPAKA